MARYLRIVRSLMIVALAVSTLSCGGKRRPAVSPFDEDVVVGSLAILPIPCNTW